MHAFSPWLNYSGIVLVMLHRNIFLCYLYFRCSRRCGFAFTRRPHYRCLCERMDAPPGLRCR